MAGQQTDLAASSGLIRHVSVPGGRGLDSIYKQSPVFAQVSERYMDGGGRWGMLLEDRSVHQVSRRALGVFPRMVIAAADSKHQPSSLIKTCFQILVWVCCCPWSSLRVEPGFTAVVDLCGDLKGMKLEGNDIFDIKVIISAYVGTRGPHLFYECLGKKTSTC